MNAEPRTGADMPGVTPPMTAHTADGLLPKELEMLRGITRQMATADDLDTVLQSIAHALVERAEAVAARIFLVMEDHECSICRPRIEAGQQTAGAGRALHLVAQAGAVPSGVPHVAPLDSELPSAQLVRSRQSVLVEDWRVVPPGAIDASVAAMWKALGVVGVATMPVM